MTLCRRLDAVPDRLSPTGFRCHTCGRPTVRIGTRTEHKRGRNSEAPMVTARQDRLLTFERCRDCGAVLQGSPTGPRCPWRRTSSTSTDPECGRPTRG